MAFILAAGAVIVVGAGTIVGIAVRKVVLPRRGCRDVESVSELALLVDEATHLMLVRGKGIYDHHMLVGDINKYNKDGRNYMKFSVFEYSSYNKGKNAKIQDRILVLKETKAEQWEIEEENIAGRNGSNIDDYEEDLLGYNIKKGTLLRVCKAEYPDTDADRLKVVEKARTCAREGLLEGMYHLLTNNCEHVVSYWLTGRGYSIQSSRKWSPAAREEVERVISSG